MRTNNPFLISGYHSPEFFCDRKNETKTIISALHNGRNVTLIAPRRMGKTGLIHHSFYNIKEENAEIITLYMDILSTQNLGDFVKLFAETVLGKLDSVPQKALSRIGKFIRSIRPVFTFDELTGLPQTSIDITSANEESTLKEVFNYLASSEKRCYIAIDEFQQITDYPEKGVEALLRSYIQFLPNVNFIFAGSKKHIMQKMFTSSTRPFYQSTQILNIGEIERREYANFAIENFAKKNLKISEDTFNAMYDRFEGHTWYIQNLLNRLYAYGEEVNLESVEFAINQVVSEYSYSYVDLLNSLTASNVRLIEAIASEECVKEIYAGEFISKYKLTGASSVSTSLTKLEENEIVYKSENGYIIYDRFMSEWLRKRKIK
ncbi:MAG: ATP-binding protein [Paludibacteraceae bacterium]|nr:ATP-binding protein [Paludibacteraceae bacterium]